jgi:copper chaperone CopZ
VCATCKTTYSVEGMSCSSCATKVSDAVSKVPGVAGTDVDLATATLTVSGDADATAIRTAIEGVGYRVS